MATRKIDLEIALQGETEFNNEMKKINSGLKTLRSDMKLCSAEFKDNASSVEALTSKQKILDQQVDQQKQKVEALTRMLAKQKDELGEDAAAVDEYARELNSAKADLIKMTAAANANAEALEKTKSSNEKYKTQLDRLKEKLGEIKQKLSEKAAAFKEAAMQVPGLSDALQVLGPVLTTTAKGFAAVTTAAAAFGAGAVAITGVALATGVKTLTTWANEAAESAKAAAEAGETLDWTQQQWLAYSNSLDIFTAKATNAKSALATILLPALQDFTTVGADILNDFTAEMEQAAGNPEMMGQVIAEYITVAAQEIQNQLPQLLNLARDLLSGLEQGFEENGDQLEAAVSEVISMFVNFVVDCAPMIGDAAAEIITFLAEALIDNAPEIIEAGVELMINLLQGLIEGLPEILAKIPGMLGEILMTILSAVPQFLVAGANLMTALWEGIKSVINQIGSWISETVSGWANAISNFMGNGSGSIVSNVQSRYSGFATGLTNVPYDDFPAMLHKGEAVLTASQAREWRAGEGTHAGSSASFTVPIKFEISNDIDGMTLSRKLYSYNLTVDNIHGTKLTKTGSTN